jgi:hypothetical protein
MNNSKSNKIAQLRQRQRLLQILIFSLITITIWVTFSLFRSQKKTIISAEQKKLAEPLNPTIKTEVLEKLQQKRVFTENELNDFPIYKVLISRDGKQSEVVTIETKAAELDQTKASPLPSASPNVSANPNASVSATTNQPDSTTTQMNQSI